MILFIILINLLTSTSSFAEKTIYFKVLESKPSPLSAWNRQHLIILQALGRSIAKIDLKERLSCDLCSLWKVRNNELELFIKRDVNLSNGTKITPSLILESWKRHLEVKSVIGSYLALFLNYSKNKIVNVVINNSSIKIKTNTDPKLILEILAMPGNIVFEERNGNLFFTQSYKVREDGIQIPGAITFLKLKDGNIPKSANFVIGLNPNDNYTLNGMNEEFIPSLQYTHLFFRKRKALNSIDVRKNIACGIISSNFPISKKYTKLTTFFPQGTLHKSSYSLNCDHFLLRPKKCQRNEDVTILLRLDYLPKEIISILESKFRQQCLNIKYRTVKAEDFLKNLEMGNFDAILGGFIGQFPSEEAFYEIFSDTTRLKYLDNSVMNETQILTRIGYMHEQYLFAPLIQPRTVLLSSKKEHPFHISTSRYEINLNELIQRK